MTVTLPPITGDDKLDSWALEVTQSIGGQGLAGGGAGGAGGGGGGGGNAVVGRDGLNFATITLYQRSSLTPEFGIVAPTRLSLDSLWNFVTNVLVARADASSLFDLPFPQEGWSLELPDRNAVLRDDYVWIQTVNISSRTNTSFIAAGDWSMVGLALRPGLGALRAEVQYNQLAAVDETTFASSIQDIFLGEIIITAQIENGRICWLIAEDDNTFNVDRFGFQTLPSGYPEAFTINAPNIRIDLVVTILDPGDTDWVALGSADNVAGTVFTATADGDSDSGTGTGTTSTTDRNFTAGIPNHVGYSTTFTEVEIFTPNNGTDPTGGYPVTSRDIEPRIDIAQVINV